MELQRIRSAIAWRVRRAALRIKNRLPHRPPPAILIYHRISTESFDPWGGAVSPQRFREHLKWLSANRTVLPLREFVALHGRGALPADAVAVTLDDGYACNSEVAAPLLTEFGVPATMFLPIQMIHKGDPFWWDELEEIVLEHRRSTLTFEGQEVVLGERSKQDRHWAPSSDPSTPRQRAYLQIHERLSRKRPAQIEIEIRQLRSQAPRRSESDKLKRPMSPEQVRRTASPLVEFGSHALNHPWLPELDESEQRREIGNSMDECRALSGQRHAAFAYPFGMFDARSRQLVEDAGFDCACTTQNRAITRGSPRFALPRLQVGDWDQATLEQAMASARFA